MLNAYEKQLNDLMVEIYGSVREVERNMLATTRLDLSISELDFIEIIGKSKEKGCTISEIARACRVTLPTVTVSIKKLEKKGFVTKVRLAEDARCVSIVLTRLGKRADAMHRYFHEQAVRACLKGIPESSRGDLLKALKNLNEYLRHNGRKQPGTQP